MKEQITITYKGETKNLSDWAKKKECSVSTLSNRKRLGWSDKRTIEEPIKKIAKPKKRSIQATDEEAFEDMTTEQLAILGL